VHPITKGVYRGSSHSQASSPQSQVQGKLLLQGRKLTPPQPKAAQPLSPLTESSNYSVWACRKQCDWTRNVVSTDSSPPGVELMGCHVHEGLWSHITVLSQLVEIQLEPQLVDTVCVCVCVFACGCVGERSGHYQSAPKRVQ
jgi:hypothetical protein